MGIFFIIVYEILDKFGNVCRVVLEWFGVMFVKRFWVNFYVYKGVLVGIVEFCNCWRVKFFKEEIDVVDFMGDVIDFLFILEIY